MNKTGWIFVMWIGVVFAYILLAAAMPVFTSIVSSTSTEMQATANMTNQPGMVAAIETAPLWLWFIPGLVGIVAAAYMLKRP